MFAEAISVAPRLDWRAYFALTKPRLSLLVVCTTGVGLWLAPQALPWPRALWVLAATALVVGAANALNCYLERDVDALMRRTRQRPLPSGRILPRSALLLALLGGCTSMAILYRVANPLTALLSFVAFALYAWVYTPMKRLSAWAMLLGAIPGAMPPLMGWTAATNRLSEPGWALAALLFFWQLPHFLAVALYFKDDYARGGLKVLPLCYTPRQTVLWSIAAVLLLLPISLWPYKTGLGGSGYALGSTALGLLLLALAISGLWRLAALERWARHMFLGSIFYLTMLLVLLLC